MTPFQAIPPPVAQQLTGRTRLHRLGRIRDDATATSMKLAGLRWLAVIPLVLAIPFLFFGLIWQAVVQGVVGLVLAALGVGIWVLFAED